MNRRTLPSGSEILLYSINDDRHIHPQKFVLDECIGEGASCVAYKATGENCIPFKLKQFIPKGMERDSELYKIAEEHCIEAFNQQITLLRAESTANITTGISAIFRDKNGCLWSCASDIYGLTYDKLIGENSISANLKIIRRIAESVKAYHEAGWLLLDLKPENILVIDSLGISGVNFFDFDSFIRKADIEEAVSKGKPLITSSTEGYSAPELLGSIVNLARVSERSDFYSLGAMLFSAIFGRKPRTIDCMPGRKYHFPNGKLSVDEGKSAASFLRHTLSASSDERFAGDDELISALDELIKLSDSSIPHISSLMPKPIAGFVGRSGEENEIISRLDAGKSPLFISGEGGMGKTQLILKTASDYGDRYKFYFTSYKGSLRDTILSIPFDNLNADSDDLRFKIVTDYLKNDCPANAVLIIDNFDADDPVHSAELLEDEEYSLLAQLPIKVIFTTRNVFRRVETIILGKLPNEDLAEMMSTELPKADISVLESIIFALCGHTMACRAAVETAAERNIPLKKLASVLSSGKSISENLRSILRLSHFNLEEKNLLAVATLFPQRGLSADILYSLLTEKQYAIAGKLLNAGWLRFDEYSNVWSMHPLIKEICLSMRGTRPTRNKISKFSKKLAEAEKCPVSFSKRSQINDIYANIGKLPKSRMPIIISSAAVLFAVIAGFWAYKTVHADDGIDPMLTITLSPSEEIDAAALQHDIEIIKGRVRALTGSKKSLTVDEQQLTVQLPRSALGDSDFIDDINLGINLFINRPMQLYAVALDSSGTIHDAEYIARSEIVSIAAKSSKIPGFSPEDYDLDSDGSYRYIEIELESQAADLIRAYINEGYETTLGFDVSRKYDSVVAFPALVPAETANTFYAVLMGAEKRHIDNIVYSLQHDELSSPMSFSVTADPAAYWEEPEEPDLNQCMPEKLDGETITVKYTHYEPESLSNYEFNAIIKKVDERLNSLGIPFAVGKSTEQNASVVCAVRTEDVSYELLNDLFASPIFTVRDAVGSYFNPFSYEISSADVALNPDTNGYELTVRFREDDSEYSPYKELENISSILLNGQDPSIYLGTKDNRFYLRASINHVISDGILVFSSMPMYGIDKITEQQLPILNFFRYTLTDEETVSGLSNYSLSRCDFVSDTPSFGMVREFTNDKKVAEILKERFPGITIYRDGNSYDIYLHMDLNENFVEDAETLITEIWNICQSNNCLFYDITFRPITPLEDDEHLFVNICAYSEFMPVSYVCAGGRLDKYTEQFYEVFDSDEFYNNLKK